VVAADPPFGDGQRLAAEAGKLQQPPDLGRAGMPVAKPVSDDRVVGEQSEQGIRVALRAGHRVCAGYRLRVSALGGGEARQQ
jgi:hypothetical protein